MQKPEIPVDEAKRLAALHATHLFGTGPEEAFDRITRMATKLLDVPTALISLVGSDVQWFKSRCGFAAQYTSRDISFCGHAILSDLPLVVPDTTRDPRFADNPIVTGTPYVRFYAGVQLYSVERARLGTLCILDTRPREIGDAALAELHELARMVEELVYHRQLALAAQELHEKLQHHASGAQLASAAGQVEFLLTHDTLTGLANRQALQRTIGDKAADWASRGMTATVACLNIDRFKRINEALGHAAGDEALVAATRSLKASLAPGEVLARTGNDEFVLLLDDCAAGTPVPERMQRLMRAVNHSVFWSGNEIALTCSIGFTCFPQDGREPDLLLNNAAAAMRHAALFGEAHAGWTIAADWQATRPFLAAALPGALLDTLQGCAREAGCHLVEIVPQFVAAMNGWRKLHRPGAWFGLVHGQVLTLAAYDGPLLAALRSAVVPAGADRDWLESHVAREALRVGVGRPERVQLCGTAPRSWNSHEGRLKFACTLLDGDEADGAHPRSAAVRLACTGSPA